MNKTFKIVLMICAIVLVVALVGSIVYYFAFSRPRNERAEWEAEIKVKEEQLAWEKEKLRKEQEEKDEEERKEFNKEQQREKDLDYCLDGAYENYEKNREKAFEEYDEDWNFQCKQLGKAPGSSLPADIADDLDNKYDENLKYADEIYEADVEACYKRYSD